MSEAYLFSETGADNYVEASFILLERLKLAEQEIDYLNACMHMPRIEEEEYKQEIKELQDEKSRILEELNLKTRELDHRNRYIAKLEKIDQRADQDIGQIISDWKRRVRRRYLMKKRVKNMKNYRKAPAPMSASKRIENLRKVNRKWAPALILTGLIIALIWSTISIITFLF